MSGRAVAAALLTASALALGDPALARAGDRWVSLGLLGGTTLVDDALSGYQWDVTPRPAFGVQALAGLGRWALGARTWHARSTQSLGQGAEAAVVRLASVELLGRVRGARLLGTEVFATASSGWLRLGYDPDRVVFDTPGGPVEARLDPVNEWIGGAGVTVRRPLASRWVAGLELERRVFALDTAHRNGSAIEYGRETFGDWGARLELAWIRRTP